MDWFKIIILGINILMLGLVAYALFISIPEEKALLRQCSEKVLCENDMLSGKVCEKYDPTKWNIEIG